MADNYMAEGFEADALAFFQMMADSKETGGAASSHEQAVPVVNLDVLPWQYLAQSTDQASTVHPVHKAAMHPPPEAAQHQLPEALPRRNRNLHPIPDDTMTLIVRNIPWGCSQAELAQLWPSEVGYNYFHLPYSWALQRNLGYVYINFPKIRHVIAFQDRWHGRFLPGPLRGTRTLDVAVARVQGWRANVVRLRGETIEELAKVNAMPILLREDRQPVTDAQILIEIEISAATAVEVEDGSPDWRTWRTRAPACHDVLEPKFLTWSL